MAGISTGCFEMAQMVDLIEKQRWSPTHNLAHPLNISKVSKEEPSSQRTAPIPDLCWELRSTFTWWTAATKGNKHGESLMGNTLALQSMPPSWPSPTNAVLLQCHQQSWWTNSEPSRRAASTPKAWRWTLPLFPKRAFLYMDNANKQQPG